MSQTKAQLIEGLNINTSAPADALVIDSSGNVGIGITAPGGNLHVQGATGNSGRIYLTDGDATGVSNSFLINKSGTLTTLEDRQSGSSLAFGTADTERLRINSSGQLLVGTTTSRTVCGQTPQFQLEGLNVNQSTLGLSQNANDANSPLIVFGKSRATTLGGSTIVAADDRLGGIRFSGGDGTDLTSIAASIESFVDGTPGSNDMPGRLVFSTTADGASSPTERMRIDSSGNVGIGTTSPSRTLHVNSGSTNEVARFESSDTEVTVEFQDTTGTASLKCRNDYRFNNSSGELVRIDSSGNVGIGTTSPSQLLDLSSSGNAVTRINSGSSNTTGVILSRGGTEVARVSSAATDTLTFSTGSSATTRLTIDSSGNVGIGTTSPSSELTISSATTPTLTLIDTTNTCTSILESGNTEGRVGTTSNHDFTFRTNNSERMRIDSSGQVGIGTTSPATDLELSRTGNNADGLTLTCSDHTNSARLFFESTSTNGAPTLFGEDGDLRINTGGTPGSSSGTERARIDTSGRLLVGRTSALNVGAGSSATTEIQNSSGFNLSLISTASGTGAGGIAIGKARGGSVVQSGDDLGSIVFAGHDGTDFETRGASIAAQVDGTPGSNDMPGRLVFSTTADGASSTTERMRITSAGRVGIGDNNPDVVFSIKASGGPVSRIQATDQSNARLRIQAGNTSESFLEFGDSDDSDVGEIVYGHSTNHMRFRTNGSEQMRIDSSGDVGIGTSSPSTKLHVNSGTTNACATFESTDTGAAIDLTDTDATSRIEQNGTTLSIIADKDDADASSDIRLKVDNSTKLCVNSSGNVGIGTTSPSQALHVVTSGAGEIRVADGTRAAALGSTGSICFVGSVTSGQAFAFYSANSEQMRISSGGDVFVAKTSDSSTAVGHSLNADGLARHVRDGGAAMAINRESSDGNLVVFQRSGTQQGQISVSGSTVTYGSFCGSHWGRLGDSSKPEILPGTILETINQVVEWKVIEFTVDGEQKRQAYNGSEENGASVTVEYEGVSYTGIVADEEPDSEHLNKHVCVKVSDTSASKAVFGVFLGWDDQEELEANNGVIGGWNDMSIAAIGNYFIRIKSGQSLEIGDLIESDGTGCGVVQSDDIIRSKTVGKVTSTTPQQTYADGSFLVTCVLYSG